MIELEIPGEAVAKQRPRVTNIGGYSRMYTPKETMNYETYVRTLFVQRYPSHILYEKPLRMLIEVYKGIPTSQSEKKKELMRKNEMLPTGKPDLDNVIKIICDALNKVAYLDDKTVVELSASKVYSDVPKVIVKIEEI